MNAAFMNRAKTLFACMVLQGRRMSTMVLPGMGLAGLLAAPALVTAEWNTTPGLVGGSYQAAEATPDDSLWTTRHCLVEPNMVVDLSSPVIGVISRIEVDRGDRVTAGATVVKLRSEVEHAEVNLKRAQVEFGKTTVKRNQELFDQKLISAQERDEIVLDSEISRLELATAQARLRQKSIVSPITGLVLERLMDPGEYVGEEPILRIASIDPLYVEAIMPKKLFGAIHTLVEAEVTLEEPVGGTYAASISVVAPVIDAASGTFSVRLLLPNPDAVIPAGLKCTVRFHPEKTPSEATE